MSAFDGRPREAPIFPLRRVSGSASEMTDGALLAACAVGDGAALGALFDRHSRAVFLFASRLLGRASAELDDVVSATFLEACRSAGAFRGGSPVRTWLFGIAVNVVRHQIRGDSRRRAFLDEYERLPPPAPGDRPDDALERQQLFAKLEASLRGLPHELREVFVLCDVEEISCAEAGRALGLRQGTVWKRLHRAREILGSALR
jgi:RNA polymerase sigma-70 factor, ECF subfamily